ncbi:hypothetical protein cypCar_00050253, partial [Cyprinus carpio]
PGYFCLSADRGVFNEFLSFSGKTVLTVYWTSASSTLLKKHSRRTERGTVRPAVWLTWSWTTQRMETITLLCSINPARGASTRPVQARTRRPGSTASVTSAGSLAYVCYRMNFAPSLSTDTSSRCCSAGR